MSETQLNQFEAMIDRDDDSSALQWLEHNFKDYRTVVQEEYELLKSTVRVVVQSHAQSKR